MNTTFNEKLIAYLALLSGLSVSAVAVYYSVAGLTAIFSAAVVPIIIMGISLEIGKIIATVWLKQNWKIAPLSIKAYLCVAVALLMIITSMGIFGFLSKAHSDQSLVSGDVLSKIAVYDEKIQIEKDNIDANRKALKQLDESVDQVMARSQDEKGADKAVAIRKSQQKERSRLGQEITESQKKISALNDERAPIATEVRKVEAEVGPIKYIAAFVYGNTDSSILERAVTWVIILIIVVFDPLALILLISSQISFQKFREQTELVTDEEGTIVGIRDEDLTDTQIEHIKNLVQEHISKNTLELDIETPAVEESDSNPTADKILEAGVTDSNSIDNVPVAESSDRLKCYKCGTELTDVPGIGLFCPSKACDFSVLKLEDNQELEEELAKREEAERQLKDIAIENANRGPTKEVFSDGYVQNEEQSQSNLWTSSTGQVITQEEYLKTIQNKQG
jgi:hypothetical protein